MNPFYAQALSLFERTQAFRRDFHRFPELGFQEVRTAGIVARELNALGLEVTTGVAKTGVVALLEGSKPGPVVLLRFDMDALPIVEETGAEYASTVRGVMHACGHDSHTAVGLTVARMLAERRADLPGAVKFVFQPAEEGMGGAEGMVAEGILQNPRPAAVMALHVWNERPVGWLGIADGPSMAAAEIFRVRVIGKGGHGAVPNLAVDPVLAAAQIVNALQSIVARNVSPLSTAVISVTMIRGGETFNVIPPAVEMQGTIRTFEPATRQRVLDRFRQVIESTAAALECSAEIEVTSLTPAVINDPVLAERVREVAEDVLPQATIDTRFATMGSEDFSFMMQDIPGVFFFVGSANAEKGLSAAHHHPKFDIDEQALPMGAALLAAATVDFLTALPQAGK